MAVAAIDPQTAHMVLVRERHRLRANDAHLSLIRRLQNQITQEQEAEHDPDRAEYRQPRQRVGTRMKNLRHSIELAMDPESAYHAPRQSRPIE